MPLIQHSASNGCWSAGREGGRVFPSRLAGSFGFFQLGIIAPEIFTSCIIVADTWWALSISPLLHR